MRRCCGLNQTMAMSELDKQKDYYKKIAGSYDSSFCFDEVIRENAEQVYCFPTKTFAVNLYREASHVAILAVK